jgi:hypothetical protein
VSRSTLRFDSRAAAAVVAAAILVSPAIPGPLGEPARRLANADADGKDPQWDRPVNGSALRRAAERVRKSRTYYLSAGASDPVLIGNLKAAGQLFFAPALPVRSEEDADVVVSYRDGTVALAVTSGGP